MCGNLCYLSPAHNDSNCVGKTKVQERETDDLLGYQQVGQIVVSPGHQSMNNKYVIQINGRF